ncbi:glycosyltransferase family 4 protein [Polynucleobacter paneuropaeus]|nr:glycosyltransferase family 4 protein [Polynucleobacter paneuropaeus]
MLHAKVVPIMIKNRRIIYLLKNNPHPVGGTAVIYEHVKMLVDSGYDAYISLQSLPGKDLYKSSAPILAHNGKFIWKSTDIVVFPETFSDLIRAFKNAPVRKIMFCQNQYNLPFFIGSQQDFFSEYLVDGLVISSEAIRDFITSLYGLTDIPHIPCSVDKKVFFPRDKKRQIAYMPRKLP